MSFNMEKERLWSAYLDGELTVAESAEFEDSLSPEQREMLVAERSFEAQLVERLGSDVQCPDDLWKNTKAKMLPVQTSRKRMTGTTRWIFGLATAAALVLFTTVFVQPKYGEPALASVLTIEEGAGNNFAASSEVSVSAQLINDYFGENGVNLILGAMNGDDAAMHTSFLLGAASRDVEGEEITEVFIGCCKHPVKIVIMRADATVANMIRESRNKYEMIDMKSIGDYLAVLVGNHSAHHVLDGIKEL